MLGGACYPEWERCSKTVCGFRCARCKYHLGDCKPDPDEQIHEALIDALDQIERDTRETDTQQLALEALKKAGYR